MSRLARRWAREDGDVVGALDTVEMNAANFLPASDGDTAQITNDVESLGDYVDEYQHATAEAQEVIEAVDEYTENGEVVDTTTAELIAISTESILRRTGHKSYNFALLSYRDTDERIANVSLESLGETLSNFWEKIKEFFRKLFDSAKNFMKGLFNPVTRLRNRYLSLKKKYATMPGAQTDATTLDSKDLKDSFGGEDYEYVIVEASKVLGKVILGYKDASKKLESGIKDLKKEVDKIDFSSDEFKKDYESLDEASFYGKIFAGTLSGMTKVKPPSGLIAYVERPKGVASIIKQGEDEYSYMSSEVLEDYKGASDGEITIMSWKDISATLNELGHITGTLPTILDNINVIKVSDAIDAFVSSVEKKYDSAKTDTDEQKKMVETFKKTMNMTSYAFRIQAFMYPKAFIEWTTAIIKYTELSMSKYSISKK